MPSSRPPRTVAASEHERRLAEAGERKARGAYYTPPDVVEGLLDLALGPALARAVADGPDAVAALAVLDPACGAGIFLAAAARRIATALEALGVGASASAERAVRCVHGVDVDPEAVRLCRGALAEVSPSSSGAQVVEADALLDARSIEPDAFDVVIGNPPFLSQLAGATARTRGDAEVLRSRFGPAISAYTDPASAFVLASLRAARPDGGTVCLIEPLSFLSARDAGGVRRASLDEAALSQLWVAGEPVFDAEVEVCAPVLVRGASSSLTELRRGRGFDPAGEAVAPRPGDGSWSALLATIVGHPERELRTAGVLGDIASATADFRDQFYGLAGAVIDDETGAVAGDGPKLVTTGLIDPAHVAWGERSCRFNKVGYRHPRVDVGALAPDLQRWAERRSVPKVLVATQTRALEAVVDVDGRLLPSVPVVSVVAAVHDLWRVAALLTSPAATLVATRRHLGSGRSATALRLSARDLLALPLPTDREAWDRGAAAFADAQAATTAARRLDRLVACARAVDEAFGLVDDEELLAWWRQRLPRPA